MKYTLVLGILIQFFDSLITNRAKMQVLNQNSTAATIILSKKSWVAYLPFIITLLFFSILFLKTYKLWILFPIIFLIYKILMMRSLELFMNDDGVWVYEGILPWNSGYRGVKWVDLDEAVFFIGFSSWALKSYKIKVSHRFTKDNEIFLTHMKAGDVAVQKINQRHFGMINN